MSDNYPNSGILFLNHKKGDNPKAPTMKGTGELTLSNGAVVELDLAGWTKVATNGNKFLALSIKLKSDRPARDSHRGMPAPANDDSIPF